MPQTSMFPLEKRSSTLTALSALAALVIAFSSAGAEELIVDYAFECPEIHKVSLGDKTYDRIIMPGAPNGGRIGFPALPGKGATILIPYGHEVTRVNITTGDRVFIGDGYYIEPVSRPFPLSARLDEIVPPTPDKVVYSQNRSLPEQPFQLIGTQSFRGYRIVTVKLAPVQYNPVSGELSYYSSLSVIVTTINSGKSAPLFRGQPEDRAVILSRVDNPETADSYEAAPVRGGRGFDLLIITPHQLAPYYEPLRDYHDTTGLLTEIHTTDDIGSSDPDDVRDYIRDRYLYDGIQYVLIGADDDIIPAKDLYVISWEGEDNYIDYDMPGDLYFGCLDGTYNYDGDGYWGEPTDGEDGGDIDLIAEVYVGRASASTAGEAYVFVDKTLQYAGSQDPYLREVVLAGEHLTFGGWGEYGGYSLNEIIDISSAHSYTTHGHPSTCDDINKLYDLSSPGNYWPTSEIVSHINSGTHIINHYGHCNTNWALKMTRSDVMAMFTNDDYCFIYSQGCDAGQFDDADCWAEYANVMTNHGAFAVVMNARYGWGDWDTDGPSQRFDREFFDAIYSPAENMPQLGRANQDSKEDNLYRINESCMRWCYYQLNLFGDPALPIKRAQGLIFDYPAGVPAVVTAEQTTTFNIAVIPVGQGIPVAGSGQLHYKINGGDVQTVALTERSTNEYEAVLPAVGCGDNLEFYISAEEAVGGRFYDPDPSEPHTVIVTANTTTLFEDDFESDKGWSVSGGLWQRGVPTGQGGGDLVYGTPDPTAGCNGPNVYGYNLDGDYDNVMPERHLTSPAIDCSRMNNVHLKFARWLGVEQPLYDHGYVRVSNNDTDWVTIWENTCTLGDREWVDMDLDISSVADDQSTLYLRWTMGTTDVENRYCGWNIDNVRVVSYQCIAFICGDADGDEHVNMLDILHLINYLYKGGAAPEPLNSADVNNDTSINMLDILYLINFLYKGGPVPTCP